MALSDCLKCWETPCECYGSPTRAIKKLQSENAELKRRIENQSDTIKKLHESLEKAVEALRWYATEGDGIYTEAKLFLRAKSTIKEVEEIFGVGK